MGKGKEGVLVVSNHKELTITKLETNYKEIETHLKKWLSKPSFPFEAVVDIFIKSAKTAAVAGSVQFLGSYLLLQHFPDPPQFPAIFKGTPLVRARTTGFIGGVYSGILSSMKRARGKEDVKTHVVAGFGAGFMGALLCGVKATDAISTGVSCALLFGGMSAFTPSLIMNNDGDTPKDH